MSKSVLISIQPKWCEFIAYGKKTVEVRKSRPKLETPFKVYIYCTPNRRDYGVTQGKAIGEFVCDKIYTYTTCLELQSDNDISTDEIMNKSCLSEIELFKYEYPTSSKEFGVIKVGLFAWNISDLVIYDTPKELSKFGRYGKSLICSRVDCNKCVHWKYMRINTDEYDYDCECNGILDNFIPLKKPPQSWCYVDKTK